MIPNAVYYNGKVALRYYQPIQKYVRINTGVEYISVIQHGVSVLLANEEDVPKLLEVKGGCCGGERKVFSLCGQEAFNVWLTGER